MKKKTVQRQTFFFFYQIGLKIFLFLLLYKNENEIKNYLNGFVFVLHQKEFFATA